MYWKKYSPAFPTFSGSLDYNPFFQGERINKQIQGRAPKEDLKLFWVSQRRVHKKSTQRSHTATAENGNNNLRGSTSELLPNQQIRKELQTLSLAAQIFLKEGTRKFNYFLISEVSL